MKKFRLKAFASEDRHNIIESVQDIVNDSKCFLISYKMFSDLQMSMYIEMKEHRLLNFYHRLSKKIKLSVFDLNDYDVHSKKTCRVYLNVSFVKGVGNLKVNVPKIPG